MVAQQRGCKGETAMALLGQTGKFGKSCEINFVKADQKLLL